MMQDYYGIDAIPQCEDWASPILSSIINKLSDFQILAMHRKKNSHLWAGYNTAKIFQSQSLLFSTVHIISDSWRLANNCKPSRHLWMEYNMTERFQSQSLPLPVVYKITDSQRLATHCKPNSLLWAAKFFPRRSHRKESQMVIFRALA